MIGEALRYYPIWKELNRLLPPGGTVLDVGTKAYGIGLIFPGSFVGLDLSIPSGIHRKMKPVAGSVTALPFRSRSFEVVICSDVLEHLVSEDRSLAVRELIRVAQRGVILGFPSGDGAGASDRYIAELFEGRGKALPSWLVEHLERGPVDPAQVEKVLADMPGLSTRFQENQSVKLGKRIARLELHRPLKALSFLLGRFAPVITGSILCRFLDRTGPYARRIYTIVLPRE